MRADATLALLRRGLLGLAALTTLGITLEMITERHWTQPVQLIAWGALALLALAIGLLWGQPSRSAAACRAGAGRARGGERGGRGVAAHRRQLRRRPARLPLRPNVGRDVVRIALVAGGTEGRWPVAAARAGGARAGGPVRAAGGGAAPGAARRPTCNGARGRLTRFRHHEARRGGTGHLSRRAACIHALGQPGVAPLAPQRHHRLAPRDRARGRVAGGAAGGRDDQHRHRRRHGRVRIWS